MKDDQTTLDYTFHHEQIKYNLLQRACWMAIIILSLVTAINIPNTGHNHWPEIAGISMAAVGLVLLWNSKRTQPVSIYISITTLVILNITYFTRTNDLMFPVPLYMIMNVLFAFYMLNRIWGISILILNFIGISLFISLRYENIILDPPLFTDHLIISIVVECILCGLGIGYLINLFTTSNEFARSKLVLLNEELRKQNNEKTVMLKEIHHRVKNNMQIISSLIRLQAITNNKDSGEYNDIIGRINAMALIHEKLYQSDMLTNFNLKNYINNLSDQIMNNYSTSNPVNIDLDIRVEKLSNRTVIPIALMFNELITNSLKYAFKGVDNPQIKIQISPLENSMFAIVFSDNGKWLESGSESGFGLELISAMTNQLDGTFELIKTETGTIFKFELSEVDE